MNAIVVIPPRESGDRSSVRGPLGWPVLDRSCLEHSLGVLAAAGARRCLFHPASDAEALRPYLEAAARSGLEAGTVRGEAVDASDDEPWLLVDGSLYLSCEIVEVVREHRPRGVTAVLADCYPTEPYTERVMGDGEAFAEVERVYSDSPADRLRSGESACFYMVAGWVVRRLGPERLLRLVGQHELSALGEVPVEVVRRPGAYRVVRDCWGCLAANHHALRHDVGLLNGELRQIDDGIWAGSDVWVGPNCSMYGPILIGSGVRIGPGSVIVGPTSIGAGCEVGPEAVIQGSMLLAGSRLGARCRVSQSLIAEGEALSDGQSLDYAAVADGAVIPSDGPAEIDRYRVDTILLPGQTRWVKLRHLAYRTIKRTMDVIGALVGIAITLPLYPFIALAIKLETAGPVFYVHKRQTVGGRLFPCLKFRTMRVDADEIKAAITAQNRADGPQFHIPDDPRLTRVGRFLRRNNLDEVPQFWNVLLGHMSMVGPRPSPDSENTLCPAWRRARLSVRPGITGLWQTMRRRDPNVGDFHEWIQYDVEYVRNQSLRQDLEILIRTLMPTAGRSLTDALAYHLRSSASPGASPAETELAEAIPPSADAVSADSVLATRVRDGVAMASGSLAGQGARLVRNMILARLLLPEHFGLMAVVLAAVQALEAITETGLQFSVVRSPRRDRPELLNAAWWLSALRGLVVFSCGALAAPVLAEFFDQPRLLSMMQVSFLAVVFSGLASPRIYTLQSRFQYRRWAVLMHGSALASIVVAVAAGVYFRSEWALVAAFVSEPLMRALLSYVLCPFVPRLPIDLASVRELVRSAGETFGLPILTFLFMQTDILVVGMLWPMDVLGMYALARLLAMAPVPIFSQVINPIMLPAFSMVHMGPDVLRAAVAKVTRLAVVIGMPLAAGMYVFADPILRAAYGRPYANSAVTKLVFAVLALCMMVRVLSSIATHVYFAIGRMDLHRKFMVARAGALVAFMVPAVAAFSMLGAARALLLAGAFVIAWQIINLRKLIGLRGEEYMAGLLPGMACSLLVAVPGAALASWLRDVRLANLVVGTGLCMLACLAGLVWLSAAHDSALEDPAAGPRVSSA